MRGLVLAALVLGTCAALAQAEEVVVTGSRVADYDSGGGVPHVTMVKRADHLITTVRLLCDTRDAKQRKAEMVATLRGLMRAAAATGNISLAHGDSVLGALTEESFDDIIVADSRPDSSRAVIVIETTVSKSDSFESATARIRKFLDAAERVGRTEILRDEGWDLTLIAPEQYRDALVTEIVADANHNAVLFGAGHVIAIDGLEHPVRWYQKGPLDLALYIPYTLHIEPGKAL